MISVLRHHAPAGVFPLLTSEMLLICAAFYGAASILYPPDASLYFLYEGGLERTLLVLATIVSALYFFDMYSDIAVQSHMLLFQQLCQAIGVALLAQSLIAYAFRDFILPHLLMLYGSVFALVGSFLWRSLYSAVLLQAVGHEKILFVGCNATVRDIAEEIASDPASGYQVVGYLDNHAAENIPDGQTPVLGPLASLRKVVAERKPGRIVVGLPERRDHMPVRDLLELRFSGCRIEEASVTYETVYKRICSRELSPARVVFLRELTPAANSLWFSQTLSRMLAALLLVLLSPLLLALAVALRIGSRSPVLARLPRLGKSDRVFQMLRFRDSRVLGSLNRRLRLAALPGLFNVLKGDMALVGPRPASLDRARRLSAELPLYEYRHNVRPGLTGWAQINSVQGNADESVRELEYDLYYIKHMSQALNAYILLNTFKNRVLRMEFPTS
jgi:lipopolysaccharide/colanic/teichoic acid biosynthesis glycosyltransferase